MYSIYVCRAANPISHLPSTIHALPSTGKYHHQISVFNDSVLSDLYSSTLLLPVVLEYASYTSSTDILQYWSTPECTAQNYGKSYYRVLLLPVVLRVQSILSYGRMIQAYSYSTYTPIQQNLYFCTVFSMASFFGVAGNVFENRISRNLSTQQFVLRHRQTFSGIFRHHLQEILHITCMHSRLSLGIRI